MASLDIKQFQSIAILLPTNPSYDAVAAALALKLSLEQINPTVMVSCPDPMTVEFHRLVGADTVTGSFGSRNLVITFPGQTEIVDKVSYNVDDKGELNLVITPKEGAPSLDYKKLKFISGTPDCDLIILVSTAQIPTGYPVTVKQLALSGSQEVASFLQSLKLPISPDAASNLLAGLEKATVNFTQNTTEETFAAAASLMRYGARRHDVYTPEAQNPDPAPDWYTPKVYHGTSIS